MNTSKIQFCPSLDFVDIVLLLGQWFHCALHLYFYWNAPKSWNSRQILVFILSAEMIYCFFYSQNTANNNLFVIFMVVTEDPNAYMDVIDQATMSWLPLSSMHYKTQQQMYRQKQWRKRVQQLTNPCCKDSRPKPSPVKSENNKVWVKQTALCYCPYKSVQKHWLWGVLTFSHQCYISWLVFPTEMSIKLTQSLTDSLGHVEIESTPQTLQSYCGQQTLDKDEIFNLFSLRIWLVKTHTR